MLNVEQALRAHYPDFVKRHRRSAQTLSRFLGFLFYQSRFQKFEADYPHLSGFVKLAAATQSPILPVHVAGRNSLFFYSLSALAKPLATLWLVREMFKQSHNTVDARIGRPVPHEIYTANGFSAQKLARMFRKHVYRLGSRGKPIFRSMETVAPAENPQLRYLFGPASISRYYGTEATARLVHFYGTHYSGAHLDVTPRTPFRLPAALQQTLAAEFEGCDSEEDFKALKQSLAAQGLPVPTLYKHYSQATSPDGVCFTAFNVDEDFGDCVDSFVIADLDKLTPRKRQRYLAVEDALEE